MPVSAHDVAAVIRARLPHLGDVKLQKLLYYCQGHHLAHFDEPLFHEPISAWDMGPVVASVWRVSKGEAAPATVAVTDEGALNTIGYVISRYGDLTGRELTLLTHGEDPWRRADAHRPPGASARIETGWIRDYFRQARADDREDGVRFDPAEVEALTTVAAQRLPEPQGQPDPLEDVLAWAHDG
jgi:uncharacterized phage-associated protein